MKNKEEYFLNIYHRSIDVQEGIEGELEQAKSHGHFYLSLEANKAHKFFGRYPANTDEVINRFVGTAIIETDKEESKHKNAIKLSEQDRENYVFIKKIRLTNTQFEKALQYANNNAELKNGEYIIGINDCTDFIQSVYNAAGLPLYFTSAYTQQQLSDLNSLAANKVLLKYGSRDILKEHLTKVHGVSREQLASKLNINIEKIIQRSPDIDISLQSYDSILPVFTVEIDAKDLLPLEIYSSREVLEAEANKKDETESSEGIMLLNPEERAAKIKQLIQRMTDFSKDYQHKLYEIGNQFIKNKIKEAHEKTKELANKAAVERAEYNANANKEFNAVKERLTAELCSESKEKSALIKAMLNYIHSTHKTPCGSKEIVVIDNLDILARKQQELDEYIRQDANATKKALADINQKYTTMIEQNNSDAKAAIDNVKKMVKGQEDASKIKIKNMFEKAKVKINEGQDVNIDKLIADIDNQVAENLNSVINKISMLKNEIIVKAVFNIEYDNPILNHPKLLYEMSKKYGPGIIDKLIDFGMHFTSNSEDKLILEDICNELDNVENLTLLMGLDILGNAV